jgi:hypothetical protein
LHRLRNKFNFPEHADEEKFSLFLAYSLWEIHQTNSASVYGAWRYLWTKQIDDFDYNIWLKHQNKYESRKKWRISVSMAICQTLGKVKRDLSIARVSCSMFLEFFLKKTIMKRFANSNNFLNWRVSSLMTFAMNSESHENT